MPTVIIHLRHMWKVALLVLIIILFYTELATKIIVCSILCMFWRQYLVWGPCLFPVTFLPTQKNFIQRGSITSRLHGVSVDVKSSVNQQNKEKTSYTIKLEHDCNNNNRYLYIKQTFYSSRCDYETPLSVNAWRTFRFHLPNKGYFTERATELRPGDFKLFAIISVF